MRRRGLVFPFFDVVSLDRQKSFAEIRELNPARHALQRDVVLPPMTPESAPRAPPYG
jgi:hypothetical protein